MSGTVKLDNFVNENLVIIPELIALKETSQKWVNMNTNVLR